MKDATVVAFQPYQNESLNQLYNLLFCDNPALFKPSGETVAVYPWNVLFASSLDANALLQLANDNSMESRVRALAAHQLLELGGESPKPELLGVIIEIGLEQGLDVLAVFGDGTARYINQAERAIVFDAPNADTNPLVDNLWHHSINVVNRIGPWDKPRLEPPGLNTVRLSFLVSGQLFFGQGPMNVFFQDPMAGPVLDAATKVMVYLTQHVGGK